MNRRRFISQSILTASAMFTVRASPARFPYPDEPDQGLATALEADVLFDTARAQGWKDLPIGEIMVRAGLHFVGTPYVGGTLEAEGPESCRMNLKGLDCVTFFENMLAFARCVKAGTSGLDAMLEQITFTRYRNGVLDGYLSRLHYTAEWISNNVSKGVVTNPTQSFGPVVKPFALHVDFMSQHPVYYKPLKNDPSLVARCADIEKSINSQKHWYVPKADVKSIEHMLRSGDIIAIATSKPGLDYAHTGMIRVDENGIAHFLHASLAKKKVVLDVAISEYLATVTTHLGITVARPVELAAR